MLVFNVRDTLHLNPFNIGSNKVGTNVTGIDGTYEAEEAFDRTANTLIEAIAL